MKKLAIAGASVALAAMPVVGVFATSTDSITSHTDDIRITVSQVCTLGTVTNGAADTEDAAATPGDPGTPAKKINDVSHGSTPGSWTNRGGTLGADTVEYDTLSVTMAAGTQQSNIGTTTFTIRCNDDAGYQLQARSGFVNGTGGDAKSVLASGTVGQTGTEYINSANTGYDATVAGTSYWNFMLGNLTDSTNTSIVGGYSSAAVVPTSDTAVFNGSNGNLQGGQSVTVTYGAGIDNHQHAGTYTGSVVYTLVPSTANPAS